MGFVIEFFVALFLLFNLLMKRLNRMFNLGFADSEQQKQNSGTPSLRVTEKSRVSSQGTFFDSIDQFTAAMDENNKANTEIAAQYAPAVNNCKDNLQYVQASLRFHNDDTFLKIWRRYQSNLAEMADVFNLKLSGHTTEVRIIWILRYRIWGIIEKIND